MEKIHRSNGIIKALMIVSIFVTDPSYFVLSHLYQFGCRMWKYEFEISSHNMVVVECKQSLLFSKRGNCEWVGDFDLLYIRTIFLLHEWIEQETFLEIYDSDMCV